MSTIYKKLTREEILRIKEFSVIYRGLSSDRLLLGKNDVPSELRGMVATRLDLAKKWRSKFPSLSEEPFFFPSKRNFEQASSEATARFKASFVEQGQTLFDLTGGAGIDFLFMAKNARRGVYIERDEELVTATKTNFEPYLPILPVLDFRQGNSEDFLPEIANTPRSFVYCDPARRSEDGRKVFLPEDISPDPLKLAQELRLQAPETALLLKLSPLLDLEATLKDFEFVDRLYILSVSDEVKELLIYAKKVGRDRTRTVLHTPIRTVELSPYGEPLRQFEFSLAEERSYAMSFAETPRRYLFLPSASLMKAGAFRSLAKRFSMEPLHPNSHLYTSEAPREDFPGKCFEVMEVIPYGGRKSKKLKGKLPDADISVRNFPVSAQKLAEDLGIKASSQMRIFATTLLSEQSVLIITRPLDESRPKEAFSDGME